MGTAPGTGTMASIGHVAVGLALGRAWDERAGLTHRLVSMSLFSLLALAPDADVVAFKLGIPYAHAYGHRGASHASVTALGIAVVVGLTAWRVHPTRALRAAVFTAIAVGSHGLLDAMTNGGLGAALLWPLTPNRYFLPWRPIPVAPIGAGMLTGRGLRVVLVEGLYFLPILLYALGVPRKPRRSGVSSGPASSTCSPSARNRRAHASPKAGVRVPGR